MTTDKTAPGVRQGGDFVAIRVATEDGEWREGIWQGGGDFVATRASRRVVGRLSDGDIIISVGCETKPAADWLAIIDGRAEAPNEAPKRGSRAWQLLEAAIRAQIAYQRTLADYQGAPEARQEEGENT